MRKKWKSVYTEVEETYITRQTFPITQQRIGQILMSLRSTVSASGAPNSSVSSFNHTIIADPQAKRLPS